MVSCWTCLMLIILINIPIEKNTFYIITMNISINHHYTTMCLLVRRCDSAWVSTQPPKKPPIPFRSFSEEETPMQSVSEIQLIFESLLTLRCRQKGWHKMDRSLWTKTRVIYVIFDFCFTICNILQPSLSIGGSIMFSHTRNTRLTSDWT